MNLLARILGVPLSVGDRDAVFARMKQQRSPEEALQFFRDGAQHNTAKSGALLGAQGIFTVVDIFTLDHGWLKGPVLAAMLVMLLGALIVMTNLRGALSPYMTSSKLDPRDSVRRTYHLVLTRSVRFNVALYLTFLSIMLLAAAALAFVG
jgi:hypothetical protein